MQMRPSETLRLMGKPVAYYPELAKPLGGLSVVVLFNHFFYWHDKTDNPLGVYRTAEEIERETGMTVQEQRTARRKLRERGILIETEKRIEHRIYYKLDLEVFDAFLLEWHQQNPSEGVSTFAESNINIPEMQNQHSGNAKSTAPNSQINSRYKNSRLLQKITTEDNIYLSVETENADLAEQNISDVADNQTQIEVANTADETDIVGAIAPTPKPSQSQNRINRKRFEAVVAVFNSVFADCSMVPKVSLNAEKTNKKRMKLIPFAWKLAKERVENIWPDATGLIDGEKPNANHVLEWFGKYFNKCKQDPFINGTGERSKAHQNWKADFEYMLRPEVLEKRVLEGV